MRLWCNNCQAIRFIPVVAVQHARRCGLKPICPNCGLALCLPDSSSYASDSHRRSHRQEKRVAEREGARCQPASGSCPGYEGDIRKVGSYRGECKITKAQSYSLKLKDLMTIERQAAGSELPVFDIEFDGVAPPRRYVVLPEWVYETLMTESGRRDDGGPS